MAWVGPIGITHFKGGSKPILNPSMPEDDNQLGYFMVWHTCIGDRLIPMNALSLSGIPQNKIIAKVYLPTCGTGIVSRNCIEFFNAFTNKWETFYY